MLCYNVMFFEIDNISSSIM